MAEIVGIDVSKRKFDCALLLLNAKFKTKVFENTAQGYRELDDWLTHQGVARAQVCMEATGIYYEALALHLHEAGHVVSVVNPARIKGFAQSVLVRTKTDRVDARLIARFCAAHQPAAWQPQAPQLRELQALVARVDALNHMLTQETNRLAIAPALTRVSIEKIVAVLAQEIEALKRQMRHHVDHHPDLRSKHDLLQSIPGIGEATIAQILACVGGAEHFKNARKLAAFLGLTPRQHLSGSSVRGRARLSKTGNARLRKAFFMPAMVAIRFNPVIKAFAARLSATGKSKMLIIGAVMRKLVHIVFGVLKSGQPFTPNFGSQQA